MIMSLKQRKIKFKPSIKLNHNIYMRYVFFYHAFELFQTIGKSCARIIFEIFARMRVANNVARIQISASTPYGRRICCWFFALLREIFFPRALRFSSLLKNQHFQIPIRPGIAVLPPTRYLFIYFSYLFIVVAVVFLTEHL